MKIEACLAFCINDVTSTLAIIPEAREIRNSKSASSLKFRVHVVANLIPTLIGSAAAGAYPAKVESL